MIVLVVTTLGVAVTLAMWRQGRSHGRGAWARPLYGGSLLAAVVIIVFTVALVTARIGPGVETREREEEREEQLEQREDRLEEERERLENEVEDAN